MGWPYYQIEFHLPHTNEVIPPERRRDYWQANLMCHLLHDYPYKEMYTALVSKALSTFKEKLYTIPDETQVVVNPELSAATKTTLSGLLDEQIRRFTEKNSTIQMLHLYTLTENIDGLADIVSGFHRINQAIMDDTGSQVLNGQQRFPNGPCELCLPFLDRIETWSNAVTEHQMTRVIAEIGRYTLEELYGITSANLSVVNAITYARSINVLSSRSRVKDASRNMEFKNGLVCNGTSCATGDGFCVEAAGGGCSAMSNP